MKILQSKLAKQGKALVGFYPGGAPEMLGSQIPSENQRKTLISGICCVMPRECYLSKLPRNWEKKPQLMLVNYLKSYVSTFRWSTLLWMRELKVSQKVLLHWGLLTSKGKYTFLPAAKDRCLIPEILEIRQRAINFLKWSFFSKVYHIWQPYLKV